MMEQNAPAPLDLIFSRRSVRRFSDVPVTDAQIDLLLAAGCNAPSSKALYPCHFIVIREERLKQSIMEFHTASAFLDKAPVVILVCGDAAKSWTSWRDDCAAATMNLIYAAEALGLSSCWCGVYPRDVRVDAIKKLFALPGHIMPYSLLAVGVAAGLKKRRDRLDESRVHREGRW